MRLPSAVRDREWSTLAGYALFVSLMTAGYYYDNITFVQLGLIDLGTRLVGLPRDAVSVWMGVLALATVVVAVAVGVTMDRRGWSADVRAKLRLLLGVVARLLVFLYALAATDARIGAALPVDRDDVAAALGAIALVLALELLSFVPIVGGLAQLVVVSVGFGAVLVTYFGWQRFEPAVLPG